MIEYYAQNLEDKEIAYWFGNFNGTLLSIGENNGIFLSNAYALIQRQWNAVLVEPAPKAFIELQKLYSQNKNVICLNVAVGEENKQVDFWDSGTHLNAGDTSLLSTVNDMDKKKWEATTEFEKIKVQMVKFDNLLHLSGHKKFDFIAIDCEGNDIIVLRQMNLKMLGCKVVIVEHNSITSVLDEIKKICSWYGLTEQLLINAENIVLTIPKEETNE